MCITAYGMFTPREQKAKALNKQKNFLFLQFLEQSKSFIKLMKDPGSRNILDNYITTV